jgi:hypothetical protein
MICLLQNFNGQKNFPIAEKKRGDCRKITSTGAVCLILLLSRTFSPANQQVIHSFIHISPALTVIFLQSPSKICNHTVIIPQ